MKIIFDDVTFIYAKKTPFANTAFTNVTWNVLENKVTTLIGSTGCGKTTLVKHINALLLPTSGKIFVADFLIENSKIKIKKDKKYKKTREVKKLRKRIGYVSQLPEHQLFEDTIYKDLIFGPKNFKINLDNIRQRAIKVLKQVGLDESFLTKNPLDLSGGEKRRVALAGTLIMAPEVIILDEPTAGLDPEGEISIKKIIKDLAKDNKRTIIIISHDMNLAMELSDYIVWMDNGKIIKQGEPHKIFFEELDEQLHIVQPDIIRVQKSLFGNVKKEVKSVEKLADRIAKEF